MYPFAMIGQMSTLFDAISSQLLVLRYFLYSAINRRILLAWAGVYDPHDSKMDGRFQWSGTDGFRLVFGGRVNFGVRVSSGCFNVLCFFFMAFVPLFPTIFPAVFSLNLFSPFLFLIFFSDTERTSFLFTCLILGGFVGACFCFILYSSPSLILQVAYICDT